MFFFFSNFQTPSIVRVYYTYTYIVFNKLNGNFIVTLIDNGRRKIIESQANLSFF